MFEHLIDSDRARVLVHREFDLIETQILAAGLALNEPDPEVLKGLLLVEGHWFSRAGSRRIRNAKISERAAYSFVLPSGESSRDVSGHRSP